ncbi:hypothetical protein [Enterovibrio nigricans]|uniref:Polysaccharide deacetylase n=1 Tax=Enterovibrio nigricans DSM 22720 TaxID=1121868 RepID=A0A1T4VNF4_9GAMM|nr:hypothetical protein [Enterovibrio nigricans]PKF49558.1 carbohydrate-binding protein [Enterovibrio nigricans]SKA66500.1 hypothetical protein SAMN02745132_04110 [Enterovibrio nigricans DSM 22720]
MFVCLSVCLFVCLSVCLFVCLSFDDNYDLNGLTWVLQMLEFFQNPSGHDEHSNKAISATFFVQSALSSDREEMLTLWRKAHAQKHDLGNHTDAHLFGNPLDNDVQPECWQHQVRLCNDFLTLDTENGGVNIDTVSGFRAPFMCYDDNLLQALLDNGIKYDSSFPAGNTPSHDGTNNYWPYTLDNGSPEHNIAVENGWKPKISNFPGLWEIPTHNLIVPPGSESEKYGLKYSLREKIADRVDWFDTEKGKGDNFDCNLYNNSSGGGYGLSGRDVFAIYAHNLDLRLKGNRAPLILGLHSEYYADLSQQPLFITPESSVEDRRTALVHFIKYALTKPEVRFINLNTLIEWMEHPTPLKMPEAQI